MLFPTTDFAIFFLVVFTIGWSLAGRPGWWKVFILGASYLFYSWWDWRFVFLLAASSALNQGAAVAISRTRDLAHVPRRILVGAIAGNLGLLGWFKYYGFASLNLDHLFGNLGLGQPAPLVVTTLPVGISFFTFMGLSYVIDTYRNKLQPSGWLDAFVYLAFFPHLVAGPIVRGKEFLPQLATALDRKRIELSRAVMLIAGGLFKKVVISSTLSTNLVDPVFAAPGQHSSFEILLAIYGYAIQIYADFSGYTDMAIGVALLLGIEFPQNFDRPYTARNLQDFWRRWHMTLSFWLRDYLYIPLGGNRNGRLSSYRNILITMVLGGLWHGAGWTFICWGLFHGVGQIIGHVRRNDADGVAGAEAGVPDTTSRKLLQQVATFHIVCLGWVFFRAQTIGDALSLLGRMFSWRGIRSIPDSHLVTLTVLAAIAVPLAAQYWPAGLGRRVVASFDRVPLAVKGGALALTLLVITTMGPQGVAPFIYYRF